MKKKFNKTFYSIMSSVLLLLIVMTMVLIFGALKINDVNVNAETGIVTINKKVSVDVYVYGEDVIYDEANSNLAVDKYIVEIGSKIYLRAVNNTSLFTGWKIVNNGVTSKPTTQHVEITVAGEVTVDLTVEDATGFVIGTLMYDMIPVTEASHLIAIQKILAFGDGTPTAEIIAEYNKLFESNDTYKKAANKATFITEKDLFTVVQNGYYGINNNLSVFSNEFKGIGTEDKPFKGVFVGTDDGTTIISTINATESAGNNYYGLFGCLDPEAVLLNLNIQTSVGVTKANSSVSNGFIYAGGVAGKFNNAFMYNTTVKAIMSIDLGYSELRAGGIAGDFTGGLNSVNKSKYNGNTTDWIISNSSNKHNAIGYIAGQANGAYLKDFEINTSKADIMFTSQSSSIDTINAVGTIYGYYNGSQSSEISNVLITSDSQSKLQSIVDYGNSYVGGAIGLIIATNELEIGDINFVNTSNEKSEFISQSADKDSKTNVYAGGLFAYIEGTVTANSEFKSNIKEITVDDKTIKQGEYIFSGNYLIEAINNGLNDNTANSDNDDNAILYGKCVSGGLVGKGYFNIVGSSANTELLINDGKGLFEVIATQSQTAKHESYNSNTKQANDKSDVEHCIASLTFGLFSAESNTLTVSDIDIYADNVLVNAVRENGSLGMGDIRVSGFIGFANETSFKDINLYINNSNFLLDSLSYSVENNYSASDSNNAYCGGIYAEVEGNSADSAVSVVNSVLAGYDNKSFNIIGTTLKIKSIQNSQAPGGKDFVDENYTGGMIGLISRVRTVSGFTYYGSESNEDFIIQQGHENPDSSFCGGIIGLIKQNQSYTEAVTISNCKVKNATIEAYATNINDFASPDIMLGGIVGASYIDESVTTNYSNLYLYNSDVNAYAYEDMETNVAGIIGALTWEGTQTITNCYVFGSSISGVSSTTSAATHNKDAAYAAGILAHGYGISPRISNCVVIDSDVIAKGERSNYVYSCGIYRRRTGDGVFYNCYVNSKIEGYVNNNLSNTSSYVIANNGSVNNTQTVGTNSYTDYTYYTSNLKNTQIKTQNTTNIYKVSVSDLPVNSTVNLSTIIQVSKGTKVYPVLRNGTEFSVSNEGTTSNVSVTKTTDNTYATDVMDLWVNANIAGVAGENPALLSEEEAHDKGWYILASINIYSGSYTATNNDQVKDDLSIQYTDGINNYLFDQIDGNIRYLKHISDNSVKVRSGYLETTVSNNITLGTKSFTLIRDIDINVYENIHDIVLKFSVSSMPLYNIVLLDANGNVIEKNPNNMDNYGTYEYTNKNSGTNTSYELVYHANPEIPGNKDIVFYIAFQIGTTTTVNYDKSIIRVTLSPNTRKLIGVKPAEYSPSLNIRDSIEGTENNPYLLEVGSITKFIPIFTRINDIEYKEYFDDTNVEYVKYTTTATATYANARSNGELVINNYSGTKYKIILTSKIDENEIAEAYYQSAVVDTVYNVSYTSIGAAVTGLNRASTECDYYFDLEIYSSYSSILNKVVNGERRDDLVITIGGDKFTEYRLFADGVEIKAESPTDNPLSGREYVEKYTVIIPQFNSNGNANIDGDIEITVKLDVVYDVTFVLNCSTFNTSYVGPTTKTYRVVAGDTLDLYFKDTNATGETIDSINQWVEEATLFGYAFNGFYLVDNADSLPAYGHDLETLVKNQAAVNTSLTFYGCWSFLIELIEAPGTHITTSFADSFMKNYYDENKVTKTIKIPINSNRGYIFTIEKDAGFIGEAEVRAFALTKSGNDVVTDEIAIEKYHENQYLYYIPPEAIKGYLVVATSVGNSELIVGENNASVSEELLPQDGVYTFKYVVNHKNTANDKSFIYNSGIVGNIDSNLDYNRDIMLEFYEQSFNGTNVSEKSRTLPNGTIIEVYYHLYVNGIETNEIVGSYIVTNDSTSRLFLKDFTLISNESGTKAFETTTFRELLGNNEAVSEVYYFSITPPNGITLENNKIINYMINAGYYYVDNGSYRYIEGQRSGKEFINIPIQGQLNNIVLHETALHQNMYSVSPSRDTEISIVDENDLKFNYKDITKYNILELTATNTQVSSGDYLKLVGTIGKRSELYSDELGFFIKDIKFTAGYNTGDIDIYGSNDGIEWKKVDTVTVISEEYMEYTSKFTTNYLYFKLDNVSGNDIHIKKLSVSDLQTAIYYDIEFLKTNIPTESGSNLVYELTNEIVGDTRHEGKKFMLALQIYDKDLKVVESIDTSVGITIGSTKYFPNDAEVLGKSVAYFNLSDILDELSIDQTNFTINLPDSYQGYDVVLQLIEAKMSYKPAMGEVRQTISLLKQIKVDYKYVYVDGATSTEQLDNTNAKQTATDFTLVPPTHGELVFGGWFLDESLTIQVSKVSFKDGNITLYGAFYKTGTSIYTATFNVDSDVIEVVTQPTGGNIVVPNLPKEYERTGYTFHGWSDGVNTYRPGEILAMPETNINLTAIYVVNTYTISFDTSGGDVIASIVKEYMSVIDVSSIPTPSRLGYTFVEWDTEIPSTMPSYDMLIRAVWEPLTYKINFDKNDANAVGSMTQQEVKFEVNTRLNKNVITNVGYGLAGWGLYAGSGQVVVCEDQGDPSELIKIAINRGLVSPTNEITVYAVWKRVITISFDSVDGSAVDPITGLHGDKINTPTNPTKEGYTFEGWYTDSVYSNAFDFENSTFADDRTLYAKWIINQYTVTFTDPEGHWEPRSYTQDYGTSIEIPELPEKEGYEVSWSQVPTETVPAYNVDYVVVYTVKQFTITIVKGNGEEDIVITGDYGSAVNDVENPERNGYSFTGWSQEIPATIPAENITINAVWEAVEYNIEYVLTINGVPTPIGTNNVNNPSKYTIEDEIELKPAVSTTDGYTFYSWQIDNEMQKMIYRGTTGTITVTARWAVEITISTSDSNTYRIRATATNAELDDGNDLFYNDSGLSDNASIPTSGYQYTTLSNNDSITLYVLDNTIVVFEYVVRSTDWGYYRNARVNGIIYTNFEPHVVVAPIEFELQPN